MTGFKTQLRQGQAGETLIARWLRAHGYGVLPVYEKIMDTGKGPQLYLPNKCYIAPDFFVFKGKRIVWVEAKHKTAFSWHRLTQRWVTGIDLRHYEHYQWIDELTPWPVWLLFLHEGGQAKDSPPDSPAGLYGESIAILKECENHRHENWGTSGMVYWAESSLKKLADISEIRKIEFGKPEPI